MYFFNMPYGCSPSDLDDDYEEDETENMKYDYDFYKESKLYEQD